MTVQGARPYAMYQMPFRRMISSGEVAVTVTPDQLSCNTTECDENDGMVISQFQRMDSARRRGCGLNGGGGATLFPVRSPGLGAPEDEVRKVPGRRGELFTGAPGKAGKRPPKASNMDRG